MFRFDFDYTKFLCGVADFKKKWSVWSYGERIKTRRKEKHNNDIEYTTVQLTDEFKNLFENYRINYLDNLQKQIIEADDKEFFYSLYSLLNLTLQMRNSNPNSGDDYLISPVRNTSGGFYDSRNYLKSGNLSLPVDADANGAYNIARKCLWQIMKLKSLSEDETKKPNLTISNKDWRVMRRKKNERTALLMINLMISFSARFQSIFTRSTILMTYVEGSRPAKGPHPMKRTRQYSPTIAQFAGIVFSEKYNYTAKSTHLIPRRVLPNGRRRSKTIFDFISFSCLCNTSLLKIWD